MEKPSICITARAESGVREKWKGTKKTKLLLAANSMLQKARRDLSRPGMSAWKVSKRATPEGEGGSARDSKLPKNGGKGSMRASASSAASNDDSLGKSIVALQKLSLKHDQEIRELAGA